MTAAWSSAGASPGSPTSSRSTRATRAATTSPTGSPGNYDWARKPDGFPLDQVCQALLTVDEMVGDVRAEMAREGRNPVYMFTSDNGMAWGVDGYPLKNVPEAGRLPVYFSGKAVVEGHTDALVSNIDFGPTLADLGGTSMPWADGVSFAGLLKGKGGGRDWMLEDHPVGGFVGGGMGDSGPWWGIRTPNWHYVEWHGPHLYNLQTDPLEMHDVALQNPGKMAQFVTMALSTMRAENGQWVIPESQQTQQIVASQ